MSPWKTTSTHIVHSTANLFKDLEESVNVFDPVQNHFLFLGNPSRILNPLSKFTYKQFVNISLY